MRKTRDPSERTHHLANLGLDLLQILLGRSINPDVRADRPERERQVRLGQVLDLAPPQRVFAERDEAEVQVLLYDTKRRPLPRISTTLSL